MSSFPPPTDWTGSDLDAPTRLESSHYFQIYPLSAVAIIIFLVKGRTVQLMCLQQNVVLIFFVRHGSGMTFFKVALRDLFLLLQSSQVLLLQGFPLMTLWVG
jgi:hypothetical protein